MNLSPAVYLLLAMACSASMALVLRFFSSSENNRYGTLLGNYLTCTAAGFLLMKDKSLVFSGNPVTYLCGLAGGILFVVSLVCMQSGIMKNGAILTSAFSKLGLIVPLALSIVFFHETPGFLQMAGVILVLTAMWLFNGQNSFLSREQNIDFPLLIAVLFTNGMADAMAKVYEAVGLRSEDSLYFFFLFFSAALMTFFLLIREFRQTGKKTSCRDLAAGILVGIPNYFSSVLLLKALNGIEALIVYPVFSSGTILIVTFVSLIAFNERLNRKQLVGLLLILLSIVLLNL